MTVKECLIIILSPVWKLAFFLSGFIPRDKGLWVFGSYNDRFVDNSKHLYIYVTESCPEIRSIWVTGSESVYGFIKSKGGAVVKRWSLRGLAVTLRAKVFLFSSYVDDINYYTSNRAVLVNLWHGIPLKKIEFDIDSGPLVKFYRNPSYLFKYILKPSRFVRYDLVLTPSKSVFQKSLSTAFRVSDAQMLNAGYPRLDNIFCKNNDGLLRWAPDAELELINRCSGFRKVYLYLPTWRDHSPNFIDSDHYDFDLINRALVENGDVLLLKLHPATPSHTSRKLESLSNVWLMPSFVDLYNFFDAVDVLISDYSSVVFDFYLTGKPIILYTFDLSDYMKYSRGLYYDYEVAFSGLRAHNIDDFVRLLQDMSKESNAINVSITDFFDYFDGSSSKRIVGKLQRFLDDAKIS